MTMPSLDVLVALVTVYIVLALTVSAATEMLTRLFGLRSAGLKSGIQSILEDPGEKQSWIGVLWGLTRIGKDGALASIRRVVRGPQPGAETKTFWNSGIIKSATDGDSRPTSLDALTFATATLSSVARSIPRDNIQAKEAISNLPLNPHLKSVLDGLADRAIQRGTSLHDELAQHFDATMEKVARWYRHWTQGIAFFLAILLTIYVNANSLDLLHQLTAHPETRLELARIQLALTTEQKAEMQAQAAATATSASGAGGKSLGSASNQLADTYKIITKDTLGGERDWPDDSPGRRRVFFGLLMTILAVSLGAPFWFDVLGRITQKPTGTDRPASSVSVQPVPAVPSVAAGPS
jgi:hypothetical protein